MTTEELGKAELDLLVCLTEAKGTIDEKVKQLEELKVFNNYNDIYIQYANLAVSDMEALKRAAFLTWISRLDPAYITGIDQLDKESVAKVIAILLERIKNGLQDNELSWMLGYYASWSFLFKDFRDFETALNTVSKDITEEMISRADLLSRGQMGAYFFSLKLDFD